MSMLKKINRDAVKSVSRIGGVTILSPKDMGKILGGSICVTIEDCGIYSHVVQSANHDDYPDSHIPCGGYY